MPELVDFNFQLGSGNRSQRIETSPFVMLLLGDFGGDSNKHLTNDPDSLRNLLIKQVDLDNIDALWALFEPSLKFEIAGIDIEITPRDLDDFHPDQLYKKLPLFDELRQLRNRLLDPETSSAVLTEVLESNPLQIENPSESSFENQHKGEETESNEELMQRLLGDHDRTPSVADKAHSAVDRLIHSVVKPQVVYELDSKVEAVVNAIDLAIGKTMQDILHHPEFQAMEGAWRSLYDLVYETELGEEIVLKVCNVRKQNLVAGLPDSVESMPESGLYDLLVNRFRQAADDYMFSLLVCNYYFSNNLDDITLLASLGALAELNGAVAIGAADSRLIGASSLADQPAPSDWEPVENAFWQQLRESPVAAHIGLMLPRILGRLPYGRDTEEIDDFDFEELDSMVHGDFLWLNPAMSCAKLLARAYAQQGWNMDPDQYSEISGLPVFNYDAEGERKMLPCAELFLPERSAEAILELGLMPIVSYRNRDMAKILRFQSIAKPLSALQGPWGKRR